MQRLLQRQLTERLVVHLVLANFIHPELAATARMIRHRLAILAADGNSQRIRTHLAGDGILMPILPATTAATALVIMPMLVAVNVAAASAFPATTVAFFPSAASAAAATFMRMTVLRIMVMTMTATTSASAIATTT